MKLTYQDPTKENWFLVSWTLSNKCNYRCSYCPDELHNGSTGQPRWETVKRFVESFKQPGKEICYRLSGGEPTHWKHFLDLAKLVKDQGHTFSFLTNGSKSVEYYKTISQYTDGYIISYHPEFADVDHIIDVVKGSSCPVFINLMLKTTNFDETVNIAEKIYKSSNNVSIWPKMILDKTKNIYGDMTNESDYTTEQLDVINNWSYFSKLDDNMLHRGDLIFNNSEITANDLIASDQNRFSGWKCWAGIDSINVDMWGNMYRADCKHGGAIGNIERYKLPDQPIICGKNVCSCLSDIYIRKEK